MCKKKEKLPFIRIVNNLNKTIFFYFFIKLCLKKVIFYN